MAKYTDLPLMEIYEAIQGEGTRVGTPSVFVRLFGCNLRCWWCDTPYSINRKEAKAFLSPEEYSKLYINHTPYSLTSLVHTRFPYHTDVVITGGEPTLRIKEVAELGEYLRERDRYVTVETNGTRVPSWAEFRQVDLWSISPKLPTTQTTPRQEELAQVDLEAWELLWAVKGTGIQLKFVITDPVPDVDRALNLLSKTPLLRLAPIYLVPNGNYFTDYRSHELGWEMTERIREAAWGKPKFPNLRILPQVHVLQYGRQRYV